MSMKTTRNSLGCLAAAAAVAFLSATQALPAENQQMDPINRAVRDAIFGAPAQPAPPREIKQEVKVARPGPIRAIVRGSPVVPARPRTLASIQLEILTEQYKQLSMQIFKTRLQIIDVQSKASAVSSAERAGLAKEEKALQTRLEKLQQLSSQYEQSLLKALLRQKPGQDAGISQPKKQ